MTIAINATPITTPEPAWRSPGTDIKNAKDANDALLTAKLNWGIDRWPLQANDPAGWGGVNARKHVGIVRDDTHDLLGVVGAKFQPFTNVEMFSFAEAIVSDGLARWEAAGAIKNGRRVWALLTIPKTIRVIGDDLVQPRLLLVNAHDGSSALRMIPTTTRIVCSNQFNLIISRDGYGGVTIRHQISLHDRVDEARRKVGLISERFEQFARDVELLRTTPIRNGRLKRFFDALVPENEAATPREQENRKKVIDDLHARFENTMNSLPGIRGSLWALFNAATEYADHGFRFKGKTAAAKAENRLSSIWFGAADDFKQRAFKNALAFAHQN